MTLYGSHVLYNSRLQSQTHTDTQQPTIMAEQTPAPAPAPKPSKGATSGKAKGNQKKKSTLQPRKSGLSLKTLVLAVLAGSKQRKGMSVPAIKKDLCSKNVDVEKQNRRINMTIVKLVTSGHIVQMKGTGASGSFRLAKAEPKKEAKKEAKKESGKKGRNIKSPAKNRAGSRVRRPNRPRKPGKKNASGKSAGTRGGGKKTTNASLKRSGKNSPAKRNTRGLAQRKPKPGNRKRANSRKSSGKQGKK